MGFPKWKQFYIEILRPQRLPCLAQLTSYKQLTVRTLALVIYIHINSVFFTTLTCQRGQLKKEKKKQLKHEYKKHKGKLKFDDAELGHKVGFCFVCISTTIIG